MPLPTDFVRSLEGIHPREIFDMVQKKAWPKGGGTLEFVNEIRPADLFCYLGGRFGPPNGMQNFLRADDSDNLIHWEWTLRHALGIVSFAGMNFRTEVHFHGQFAVEGTESAALIEQLKTDFSAWGSQMAEVRHRLENWVEFVNPYQRLRRAIDRLVEELDALELRPGEDNLDNAWTGPTEELKARWKDMGTRYSSGFGLCFGIRSMLPVLAEAYVNLILFILMRPELKSDERLRESVFRQPIDVRIKSLSVNCIGFARQPDYSSEACRRYQSLVNERNDLLHGNVVVDKLKFNEVYFLGKVPVFKEYRTIWQRSLEVEMDAVGLRGVREEMKIVADLVSYLQSCLDDRIRPEIERMTETYELGFNAATQRLGVLFPPWLVDMRVQRPSADDVGAGAPIPEPGQGSGTTPD